MKFTQLFSKSPEINALSAARLFLFASRDVWFVVGLPIFLHDALGWGFSGVGAFLAAWIVGYGLVQAAAPRFLGRSAAVGSRSAQSWGFVLALVSAGIALAVQAEFHPTASILIGLAIFGVVFAVNSSLHSYLILAYTDMDNVALNVGFYYMANAAGRLLGTLLSGVAYIAGGLPGCLWTSTALVVANALLTLRLPAAWSRGPRAGCRQSRPISEDHCAAGRFLLALSGQEALYNLAVNVRQATVNPVVAKC